jgi:hypothetical protein
MRPRNIIVRRSSPDWAHFDIEQSRQFLARIGLDETIIVDFAAIWDATFAIDYCRFRQRVKEIATRTLRAVRNAALVELADFKPRTCGDDDLIAFIDDDDWLHLDLFDAIRSGSSADGAIWGSVVVGDGFLGRKPDAVAQIELRPIKRWVFTNNYAVTGRLLKRLAAGAVIEHDHAHEAMLRGKFQPAIVRRYLSATNKHPCSILSATHHLQTDFRQDPRSVIAQRRSALAEARLTVDTKWMAREVSDFLALYDQTLAQR